MSGVLPPLELVLLKEQSLTLALHVYRHAHTVDTIVVFENGSLARRWTRARRSGAITTVCPEITPIHNPTSHYYFLK